MAKVTHGCGEDLGEPLTAGESPGKRSSVKAVVYSITPAATPGGRSIQVKLRSTEGAENLLDGSFVTAWIVVAKIESSVVLPTKALVFRDNQTYVFVVSEGLSVTKSRVKLGLRGFGRYEVLEGVKVGERIVTEGRTRLSNGCKVHLSAEVAPR